MESDSDFSYTEDDIYSPIQSPSPSMQSPMQSPSPSPIQSQSPSPIQSQSPSPSPINNLSFSSQLYPLSFFYGYDDIKYKEYSNKILLPQYILETLSGKDIEFPLFFYIEKNDKRIYFGVEKFLPDISDFFIPNYIFENLGIVYGELQDIKIEMKTLRKGNKIVLEPHDKEFLEVPDPKLYLETHIMKNYQCLSKDSIIRVLYKNGYLDFNVKKVEPVDHICTVDTDIEVEFEKPINYIEPIPDMPDIPMPDIPMPDIHIPDIPMPNIFVPFSGKGNKLGS